jgi:hypothetical protein
MLTCRRGTGILADQARKGEVRLAEFRETLTKRARAGQGRLVQDLVVFQIVTATINAAPTASREVRASGPGR